MVRASSERVVAGTPDAVYAVLTDLQQRRALLPEAYADVSVEGTGGIGSVTSFRLHAGGRQRDYRMKVAAAEPGRRVREQDELSSLTTEWRLTPAERGTRVQVETAWQGAGGVGGFFERMFAPKGVARLQAQTLERLAGRV